MLNILHIVPKSYSHCFKRVCVCVCVCVHKHTSGGVGGIQEN